MNNIFDHNSKNPILRMHECGADEYWFYHKESYPDEYPLLYERLIRNASNEIIIWDPYFNVKEPNRDQDIFSNLKDNITIKILTFKGLDGRESYLSEVQNALKLVIPESKNCRFGLRVINKGDTINQGGRFFHDRFLIIDNTDLYLIGSSVGHHLKPEQSTGIYKVSNFETSNFIKSIFDYYWNNSYHHEIPTSYLHLE